MRETLKRGTDVLLEETPNTALQLADHSAFRTIHGTIWHSTRRFDPTSQRAGS